MMPMELVKESGIMLVKINKDNANVYRDMVQKMYASGAVAGRFSFQVIENNIQRFAEEKDCSGYLIKYEDKYVGYVLLSYMYSTEFGAMDAWLEELYIDHEYQGHGLGTQVISLLKNQLKPNFYRIRLEVARGNEKAINLYKKLGFESARYDQMVYLLHV